MDNYDALLKELEQQEKEMQFQECRRRKTIGGLCLQLRRANEMGLF